MLTLVNWLKESQSRVVIVVFLLLLASIILSVNAPQASAQVANPTYTNTIVDCVTGNNQFRAPSDGKFHWYVNDTLTTADGAASNTNVSCDSY